MNKIVACGVCALVQLLIILILSGILVSLDWWPATALETFVIVAAYAIFFDLYKIQDNVRKE